MAAIAAATGDEIPKQASAAERAAAVSWEGGARTLGEALDALERAKPAARAAGNLVERWRFPMPTIAMPPQAAEPVERIAVDAGNAILVQTAMELLELDPARGVVVARVPLETPADPTKKPSIVPVGAKPIVGFPGKRRARPATDGRFVAVTVAGVLRVFERAGGGFQPVWSRGKGFHPADSDESQPTHKDAEILLYCDGAALVGGRLFVASVSVGTDTASFLECFDPATGERHFKRAICKGSVLESKDERRFAGRLEVVLPEPLLYRSGRVIVSTNLGIVASVDPLDGEIDYLLRVERSEHSTAYDLGAPTPLGPAVAVAPPDSDFAYALHPRLPAFAGRAPLPFAFDGAPMPRKDGRNEPLLRGAFRRLVGSVGTRALFLGNVQVVRRKLQSFDFATRALEDDELGPGEEVVGRPVILGNRIHVPTNHGIVSIDAEKGFRDVFQTPLPLDASTRQAIRGDEALGDLAEIESGLVSVSKNWVIRYDVPTR